MTATPASSGVDLDTPRPDAPAALVAALDRFLLKLEVGEVPAASLVETECWVFTGSPNTSGYGQFRCSAHSRSPMLAHVAAYLLFCGPLEPGEQVHHQCENRRCCRPSHLQAKGRRRHLGEHNKARTGQKVIGIGEENRDGQVFKVYEYDSLLRAPSPKRRDTGRSSRAVSV